MKTATKIRYERQTGKGAATFVGHVYFDDGSKVRLDQVGTLEGMPDLPIEHDELPEPLRGSVVSFGRAAQQAPRVPGKRPQRPVWPWKP